MSKPDYYSILGVARNAPFADIKEAYHKLAMEYHPDKHTDNPLQKLAEERFKEIQEAYKTLSDPRLRSRYDSRIHGSYAEEQPVRKSAAAADYYEPGASSTGDAAREASAAAAARIGKFVGICGIGFFVWQIGCFVKDGYWTGRSVLGMFDRMFDPRFMLIPWVLLGDRYTVIYRSLDRMPFALSLVVLGCVIVLISWHKKK